MEKHYDVGILGVWFGCNYGSIATYYALERTIAELGLSTLMVHRPRLGKDDGRMEGRHSIRFAREHYAVSESYHVSEIGQLNDLCGSFVLGSDQLWNYGVTRIFGHSYFLDFAAEEKRKIAYATSFGSDRFLAPWPYAREAARCMRRMDAISVREEDGVRLCRRLFGMPAVHVLDPVLMARPDLLSELAEKSARRQESPYLAAYILDPTPVKRQAILSVSRKRGLSMVNLLDGWYHKFPENKKKLNLENTIEQLQVEEWLCYLKHSEFIITDSFHGTCMAILFGKPFIAIGNPQRGTSRFESLLGSLKLTDRYVADAGEIPEKEHLMDPIKYETVNEILAAKRAFSRQWLQNALLGDQGSRRPTALERLQGAAGLGSLCAAYYAKASAKRILDCLGKERRPK